MKGIKDDSKCSGVNRRMEFPSADMREMVKGAGFREETRIYI